MSIDSNVCLMKLDKRRYSVCTDSPEHILFDSFSVTVKTSHFFYVFAENYTLLLPPQ